MVEHKFIERITWESFRMKETLEKVITRLLNTMNKVKALDESQELTLPYFLICQIKLENMSLSMQLKNTSNGVR
ncbi:hypothetical protein [Enterococcus faecium]|uniref:hypothetical protein n=1 Tax=Enterococcus faecium TaxID=1352 RepID=UPI003564E94E